MNIRICAIIASLAAAAPIAQAQLGTEFTYQGQLRNGGSPATGVHDLRFRLYDAISVGAPVGAVVCRDNVTVTEGLFTVPLDFGAQFAGQQRFLEIEVRADTGLACANTTGFIILTPRQALTATPYALYAQSVPNPLSLSGTSDTHIIRGENASETNFSAGVLGLSTAANGVGYGGRFESASTSTGASGVYGLSSAPTGLTYGVYGQTASNSGRAVSGLATATTGFTQGVFGVTASTTGIGVYGAASAATGDNYGVLGTSPSTAGRGVFGQASAFSGITYGGEFKNNSTSGAGVVGKALATSGGAVGGLFESASLFGVAVKATNTGTGVAGDFESENITAAEGFGYTLRGRNTAMVGDGFGVMGESESDTGGGVIGFAFGDGASYGVYGGTYSTSGRGVFGGAFSSTGSAYGVHGYSDSASGRGVYGEADAASGTTYGVYGESASPTGRGTYGRATATTGTNTGVYGESASSSGRGVFGFTSYTGGSSTQYGGRFQSAGTTGRGVFGWASAASGVTYGVIGQADTSGAGYAVFANGDLGGSGFKGFRIDHPADPANKYLLHYAAESPEVINFYRGTAVLDGEGGAVVELPHYFARINKSPSYVLTAVGAPMPMLHVGAKINDAALNIGANAGPGEAVPICSFRIAGGAPGGEVSWRIEAVRNDKWVQRRGARVEIEKQGLEKGTYQHPELYGQSPKMGMDYDAAHEHPDAAGDEPVAAATSAASQH